MTDIFSYLLPYPAVFLFCDSKLQPFTNLPSKLIVTVLLVDSESYPLLLNRGSINSIPPSVECAPRLSYGSTATVIQLTWEKKETKFDADTILLALH